MELVASARLRRAQLRIEAMRPYADRMTRADGGHRAGGRRRPAAAARAARERADGRDRARSPATAASPAPSTRRCCAARSRCMREAQAAGQEVRFFTVGTQGASTDALPPAAARAVVDAGSATSPSYADAQAIAHALAEAYIDRRGRPGRHRLQRLRLAARPAGDRQRCPADPRARRSRATDAGETDADPAEAAESEHPLDFFFEPEPRNILERLLPGLRRDRSSTARCSSRPPRSSARR